MIRNVYVDDVGFYSLNSTKNNMLDLTNITSHAVLKTVKMYDVSRDPGGVLNYSNLATTPSVEEQLLSV